MFNWQIVIVAWLLTTVQAATQCDDPGLPSNSDRIVSNFDVGEVVTFVCKTGYEISDDLTTASIECLPTRRWNASIPSCKKITCGDPGDRANTNRTGTFEYQDVVTYTCIPGYRMSDWTKKKVINCQANKKWNPTPEGCERIQCMEPEAIPFANRTSAAVGPYWLYSKTTFECWFGYRAKVPAHLSVSCGDDGKWKGLWPLCLKIRCNDPGMVANAGRIVTGNGAGTVLIYSCNRGYMHDPNSGPLNRTCLENATWTGSGQPLCVGVPCPRPRGVANATFTPAIPTYRFPETIKYKCDTGYKVNYTLGIDEITCTWQRKYDFQPLTCDRVRCIEKKMSQNTEINNNNYYYGDVKEMKCIYGYELMNGSRRRTCEADGYFSDDPPICTKVKCSNPVEDPRYNQNVQIQDPGNVYKHIVTFECEKGYEIAGDQSLMYKRSVSCKADGFWDPALPVCTRVSCSEPDKRLNVQFESYTTGAHYYGDVVKYNCTDGYEPKKGDANRTCQASRRWSGETFECIERQCSPLPVFQNGDVIGTNTRYNGQISFICHQGFSLVGEQTLRCQANGQWTFSQPVCERISCGMPDKLPHATWKSDKVNATNFIYGEKVTYQCDYGYYKRQTSGPEERQCTETTRWSGNSPKCDPYSCQDPGDVPGTYKLGVKFTYGEIVNYTCATGFEAPSGIPWTIRKCELGIGNTPRWSGIQPNCRKIVCRDPGEGINCTRVVGSFSYGGTIRYHCIDGTYYPDGRFQLTCLETKNWSAPVPVCQAVLVFEPVAQPPVVYTAPAEAKDAQTYGFVGIAMMSFEVLAVIILDLSTIQKEINLLRRNLNIKVKKAKKKIVKLKNDLKEDLNKLGAKKRFKAAGMTAMAGVATKASMQPPPYESPVETKDESSPPPPYLGMATVAALKAKAQKVRKTKYSYRKPGAPPPYSNSGHSIGFSNPVYPVNATPLKKSGSRQGDSTDASDLWTRALRSKKDADSSDPWTRALRARKDGDGSDPWARPVRPKNGSGGRKIYMA